jgi:ribosome-binding protein aMBF1 (putative translation factor)
MYGVALEGARLKAGEVQRQGRQPRPPNIEYRIRFGAVVRAKREATSISQEDLANQLGMGRRYIGAIERGEAAPTLDRIVLIAQGLGLQPGDLLPEIQ